MLYSMAGPGLVAILRLDADRNRGQFDTEQDGPTGNAFNEPFLNEEIEITAGVGTIYLRLLRHFFCAEATITT